MLSRQRESNLSYELKIKMALLQKQQMLTRHKLRHVWDNVIQGNIGQIEASTKRAIAAIAQGNSDITHLISQFPNNAFLMRVYARFLREIMADYAEAQQIREKLHVLMRGGLVNRDHTQEFALLTFRALPGVLRIKRESVRAGSSENAQTGPADNELDDEVREDMDHILTLRRRIEGLVIPAAAGVPTIRGVLFVCIFFIPAVAILVWFPIFLADLRQPVEMLSGLAVLRAYTYQIASFAVRLYGEEIDVFTQETDLPTSPPVYFGLSWDTEMQLKAVLGRTVGAVQQASVFRGFQRGSDSVNYAQRLFFGDSIAYKYYTTPDNFTLLALTPQAALMDFVVQDRKSVV
jgi:hypothetical protein